MRSLRGTPAPDHSGVGIIPKCEVKKMVKDEFYEPELDDCVGIDWLNGSGSKAEKQRKELERLEAGDDCMW